MSWFKDLSDDQKAVLGRIRGELREELNERDVKEAYKPKYCQVCGNSPCTC